LPRLFAFGVKRPLIAEPRIIDEIVLTVAYPRRSEHFGFIAHPMSLFLFGLADAWLYNSAVSASDCRNRNRHMAVIIRAATCIVVRSSDDVAVRVFILQQNGKRFLIDFQYVVFFNVDFAFHCC